MKTIFFLAALLCAYVTAAGQSIFDNPITGTNPNSFNPYTTGQTVDPNITASGIGRGPGVTGSNANNRYTATQWNSASLDASDYFEFILMPNTSKTISFTSFVYTGQASGTGPLNFSFRSSLDNFTTNIGSPSATGTTINLSAPVYQNIAAAISFRFYGWNAGSSTGTFSINDFTFSGVTTVLPVSLEYFTATKQDVFNLLRWKVDCSNSLKALFTIEHSMDALNFNAMTNITADATRCLQPFLFIDHAPAMGNNYYRIVMTDDGNRTTYSNIAVLLNKETVFTVAPLSIVANDDIVVNITAAKTMAISVTVIDITGKLLLQNKYVVITGLNKVPLHFRQLAAGLYQMSFNWGTSELKAIRFIKQ